MRGVERSEQNNPASCFANGDRRFLRDVTSDKTQNVEQKSRTIPLGFTPEIRTRVPSLFLVDPLMRGVELSEQNNPVSCFANGNRRFLRDTFLDLDSIPNPCARLYIDTKRITTSSRRKRLSRRR